MRKIPRESPWRRTLLLFAGHLLNDGYAALFAPLLPLLIDRLGLSLALAGTLGTVRILVNSLLQPGLGHLIDRTQRPWLVAVGPILTISAMGFIGRVGSFAELFAIMVVAGAGTALFHPAAAAMVAAGTAERRAVLMALFSAGGTLGGAVAPLLIVSYTQATSLRSTPWLVVPGLIALLLLYRWLRRCLPPRPTQPPALARLARPPRSLVVLWLAVVLRSAAATAFASFLAVLVDERGGSAFLGAAVISTFLLTGAAGGFAAGGLSERFGRKVVILASLALATPSLYLFLGAPLPWALPTIALAGVLTLGSTPVGVVAAQEVFPGRAALVSGLVMGTAWGVGGLALVPVGWFADRFGLLPVMRIVALLPLLGAAMMLLYRRDDDAATPA